MLTRIRAVLLALVLGMPSALAHDDGTTAPASEHQAAATAVPAEEERARQYFTDLPLVSHAGETLRFFSDVLKDHVVAVTFFYTECTGMCPLTNQKLADLQDLLGESLGRDIYLVTISIDPETDTPEVLRDYRQQFGARDGWLFLTGQKANIDEISRRMGQIYPKESHLPLILLGNVNTAHWQKARPNVPEEVLAVRLQLLAEESAD